MLNVKSLKENHLNNNTRYIYLALLLPVVLLLYLASFSVSLAYDFSSTPDHGGNESIVLDSSDFQFYEQSGGSNGTFVALTIFEEDGDFLYVSGNPTNGAVNWFGNSNGHGSGDVTFSTQRYRLVAWYGEWSSGVLQNSSDCYGGTYDQCTGETEYIETVCYGYGLENGDCEFEEEPPPEGGGELPDLTILPNPLLDAVATTTCTRQDGTTTVCISTAKKEVTYQDWLLMNAIIIALLGITSLAQFVPRIHNKLDA